MPEWDIDLSEVNGLRHWYRDKPQLMRKASAQLLNRFAWGTRDEASKQIGRVMTVRNRRFVDSRLRVTQTTQNTPIDRQRSIAGSIASQRFSGWTEQEKGTPTARKRVSTLASRGGSMQRQMLPRTRLKPAQTLVSMADFKPRTNWKSPTYQQGGAANYGGFIAMLVRDGYRGLVYIKGSFYMIQRGGKLLAGPKPQGSTTRGSIKSSAHLTRVQSTKKEQPRKIHWMRQARAIYFKKNPPQRTWNAVVDRLMRPPKKN